MILELQLILIGLNLLFLIGMAKFVNVQHAMLYFKFLAPQHMWPHMKAFFMALFAFLFLFFCHFINPIMRLCINKRN